MTNWKTYKLGELVDYVNGGAWPAAAYTVDGKGIPIVRVTDVQNYTVDLSACKYLKPEFKVKYEKHKLLSGDLIVCTVGSHPIQQSSVVGKTASVSDRIAGAFLNQNAVLLRTREELIDKKWLNFFARTFTFKQHVENNARGSANQVRLAISSLLEMEVELPPLQEQIRIAEILFALDDKIELNRRMNQTLEQMAQTIFRHYFVEGIDANNLPEGWSEGKIKDICIVNSRSLAKKDKLDRLDYIDISSVGKGIVNSKTNYKRGEEPSRARRRLSHGDTVISTVRPDRGSYFLAINPDEELIASTGFAVFTSTNVPYSYLYLLLTQEEYIRFYGFIANGAAYPAINPETILNMEISIPLKETLNAFHAKAEALLLKIDMNNREANSLAQTRDTLLPKLMSGEIDVMQAQKDYEQVLS